MYEQLETKLKIAKKVSEVSDKKNTFVLCPK